MYLSVDIGGTHTRVAVAENPSEILHVKKYGTPQDYHQALEALAETIVELTSRQIPEVITVALPGVIDKYHGRLVKSPHLPEWQGSSIRSDLEKILKARVLIENDASLAGLAEANVGAGKGYQIVAYLTLSTGVGGARIVEGRIDNNSSGFEPGHQIIDPSGEYWEFCGQRGCFESFASGTAFEKRFGISPEKCNNPATWATHAKLTAPGIVNIITLWSPDCVVIGGGLSLNGDILFEPLRHYVEEELHIFPCPPIKQAQLDDNNVLIGGLLFQQD